MSNQSFNFKKWFVAVLVLTLLPVLALAQGVPSNKAQVTLGSDTSSSDDEDWNSLSIESSHLRASTPIPVQRDEGDGFVRDWVQVEWRTNDPIYLYIIRPKGIKKPPAILYLYSLPGDIDRFRNDALCSLLVKNGFAAIGFAAALTGHRYHDRPMKEWFISELKESLTTSVHDVQMILNYLATRDDLDMDRIGMFGEGSGGSIAILASAVEPRLKAIDLFAPWGDWPDWLAKSPVVPTDERATYLKPEFLKQVASLDPVDWLPKVKAAAIRLQYADDQWGTPKAAQDRMKAAAPQRAKVISYADTNAEYKASSSLLDWIKQQLSPAASHEALADRQ